jgi:mannose-6-phosphate isomerase-like protein (cupin superfamily)
MRTILTVLALCAPAAALAQSTPPKTPRDESGYVSEAELQQIIQSAPVSKDTGKPGSFSRRIFNDTTFSAAFIRLEKADQPHAHGVWSEIFVVKEGSGILETGGTITGNITGDSATHRQIFMNGEQAPAQPPSPAPSAPATTGPSRNSGDKAGTDIEGGHKQAVKAGDVVLIPAGVAHRWFQVDKPVVYLDIKFPKAE